MWQIGRVEGGGRATCTPGALLAPACKPQVPSSTLPFRGPHHSLFPPRSPPYLGVAAPSVRPGTGKTSQGPPFLRPRHGRTRGGSELPSPGVPAPSLGKGGRRPRAGAPVSPAVKPPASGPKTRPPSARVPLARRETLVPPPGRRPLLRSHGAGPRGPGLSRAAPGGQARSLCVRGAHADRVASAGGGGQRSALGALLAAAHREPGRGQVASLPGRVARDGGRHVAGGRPGPGALLPHSAVHRVPREGAGPGAPRLVPPHRPHRAAGRAAAAEHDAPGEPGREAPPRRAWEPASAARASAALSEPCLCLGSWCRTRTCAV